MKLPNGMLATYIRQEIALSLVVPEAHRRINAGLKEDGSEMFDDELSGVLRRMLVPRYRNLLSD